MKKQTIIRTAVLAIALLNEVLVACGKTPLPVDNEQAYEIVSVIVAAAASIWTWWKNNSFTTNAQLADDYLKRLKGGR